MPSFLGLDLDFPFQLPNFWGFGGLLAGFIPTGNDHFIEHNEDVLGWKRLHSGSLEDKICLMHRWEVELQPPTAEILKSK